jgi:hypothetical protein
MSSRKDPRHGAGYGATPAVAPLAVAQLPSAAAVGAGARAFVNDANATTYASAVAGGGANKIPVYSDGSTWRIG